MKEKRYNLFSWLFHPRRCLRVLRQSEQLHEENSSLVVRLNDSHEQITKLKTELQISNQQANDLQQRLERTLVSVEELTKTIIAQRKQLDELKDTDARLNDFISKLEEVEKMKASYESRIKNLKLRLENAIIRNRNSSASELDDPSPIDMNSDISTEKPEHSPSDPEADADWLQHLK